MQSNRQLSNLKDDRLDRLVFLLLGSIYTGISMTAGNVHAEPIAPPHSTQESGKLATTNSISTALDAIEPPAAIATPTAFQIAQASDIRGNWAEPFIQVLIAKDIIKGYPDGTFQPDKPVTRAEFAALLNRAFDLQPVRAGRQFKDVSTKYWAHAVIQKAFRGGFIAGNPDGSFAPDRPILRIQSLVALINGTNLAAKGDVNLDRVFGDAAQVPSYGRNALIAATQKCLAVSAEYDSSNLPGGNFGANTPATRADVAAYIHQVLVATGRLTALDRSSAANKYVAACPQGVYVTSIADTTPRTAQVPNNSNEAIEKLGVSERPPELVKKIVNLYPVNGLTTPTAFGANWGDAFIGASYQSSTRVGIFDPASSTTGQARNDGAVYLGFGLGDSRTSVGLETVAVSYSTSIGGFFNTGSLSFKLHKQFGDNFAIAGGFENAIPWSKPNTSIDGGQTGYGVASWS
jgi:S-layer homology domain